MSSVHACPLVELFGTTTVTMGLAPHSTRAEKSTYSFLLMHSGKELHLLTWAFRVSKGDLMVLSKDQRERCDPRGTLDVQIIQDFRASTVSASSL